MSLGPVDFQHMVAMSKEIERIQRLQEVRQHHQAQEIPQAYDKKVERESRRVREVAKGEDKRVEENASREREREGGRRGDGGGKGSLYNGKANLHRLEEAEEGEHDLMV
ncbi:MAG: hypothetical protein QME89_01240 [Actinomycetota bacterium]|jgi:hypothetical protein|nr:hypothetical protein [Actinomycetota bacterium]MDI7251164.1 hypothetical protein [Actinomycetota bacterium]